jgi:predicted MPP superfamily phosphohydrolase
MNKFIQEKILTKTALNYVILAFGLAMGIYFKWQIADIVVYLIFLRMILVPFPSKYPAFMTLIFLIVTPVLLIAKKDDWAEQIAVWAYFFLVMTVFMLIYEYRKENREVN